MSSNDNKGLGKGLSALIGGSAIDRTSSTAAQSAAGPYQELSISQIIVNPNQPRTHFDEESLSELAQSIRAVGLVQPVLVRKKSGGLYELVAGERRWRAAQIAGLDKIPAVVRDTGDAEALELALIENINREDLNAIDAARAYANLQEEFGTTQEDLAAKLGRSRSAIANTVRLLDLPDEIQEMIEQGKLSEGHGRALLSVPDRSRQKKLAARVVAGRLSVRQTEDLARKASAPPRTLQSGPAPLSQELMDEATDALYSALQLPVKVRWAGKAGKIEVEFSGKEQLKRVLEAFSSDPTLSTARKAQIDNKVRKVIEAFSSDSRSQSREF